MAAQSELTDLFEYGIDTKNRRIYFGCMSTDPDNSTIFNSTSVEFAVRALHKMIADNPNKSVEFHINSFGGSVYDALRLHDEILAASVQVKFYGGGAIMSAATIIMVACDERYIHQNTRIMFHELSDSSENMRKSDIKINTQENDILHDTMCNIYASNSRLPKDFWNDIMSKDVYLSASEAVSMGLADKIIEPKKRGNLRKVRQAAMRKEINNKDMKNLVRNLYERTNRSRIPKIELNEVKKEASDPHIVVDTSSTEIKTAETIPPSQSNSELDKID
jgi:ATP-dependent protease ClpP protease subunit